MNGATSTRSSFDGRTVALVSQPYFPRSINVRVLLTGARAPVTLDLARRLKRLDATVFVCDSLRFPLASRSNAVDRFFSVPSPRFATKAFVDQVNRIIQLERIELLIPTCEEIFYVAANKASIGCSVLCDAFPKLALLHNKWLFNQWLQEHFDCAPSSQFVDSELDRLNSTIEWSQIVLKPVYSRFGSHVVISPTTKQLARIHPSSAQPWIIQNKIVGQEYSTYSVAHSGNLSTHVCYRSLYRAGKGAGIYFEAVAHSTIRNFIEAFVQKFEFSGQVGFDIIEDADGKIWVLECNPRATSGLHLLPQATSMMDLFTSPAHRMVEPVDSARAAIGFAMGIWGVADSIRHRRLRQFYLDWNRANEVVFRMSDSFPMGCFPLTSLEIVVRAIRHGITLQQASTLDIEWDGEKLIDRIDE